MTELARCATCSHWQRRDDGWDLSIRLTHLPGEGEDDAYDWKSAHSERVRRTEQQYGRCEAISNHSLRRSFVTAAKASGESYDDIAETVGHTSTATTKRYDKLIGSLDRDISHGVAGFLSNLAG